MTPAWPSIPSDAALSAALAPEFPRGVKLVQATPERTGRLTLRLETAPGETIEGLLFAPEAAAEFEAVRAEYAAIGARAAASEGLFVPLGGADRELPALRALLASGSPWRLVRHRLERRAVLRNDAERVHGKLFKSRKRAERAARTLSLVREARLPAPEVRSVDPRMPLVAVETVPGDSLLEILAGAGAPAACHAAGAALALLARAPLEAALPERHGVEDEFAVIDRWLGPLRTLAPGVHAEASRLCGRLRETARRLGSAGDLAPSHRDYYDKQILLSGGAARIVDWDSLAMADPALDAGNFLAHLALRVRQGKAPAEREEALRRAFLDGRGDFPTRARVPFFEAAALLRIAALYALRPPHARLVPGILAAAAERGEIA